MSERINRTLLDMVRSMMGFASLPVFFWDHALETSCHILNRVPTKLVAKTPYEIRIGRRPILFYLRIWGCPAYVKYLQTNKLGPHFDKCYFIGYPKETKGYYFYLIEEQKMFVSNKAFFLEKEFFSEGTDATKVELDKVRLVEELTQIIVSIESNLIRSNPKSIVEASLRRSSRVPCQLDRYYGFLIRDGDLIELDKNNKDLITYIDAM